MNYILIKYQLQYASINHTINQFSVFYEYYLVFYVIYIYFLCHNRIIYYCVLNFFDIKI